MAFPVVKKVDLSTLGEGWEGAYVFMSVLTFAETKEFAGLRSKDTGEQSTVDTAELDVVTNVLKRHFVSGKAWNGEALVDLTVDDLTELPVDAVVQMMATLGGKTDPNS